MEVVMGNLESYPYREIGSRRTDWSLEALPYCEHHIKYRCAARENPLLVHSKLQCMHRTGAILLLRSTFHGTFVDRNKNAGNSA